MICKTIAILGRKAEQPKSNLFDAHKLPICKIYEYLQAEIFTTRNG